VRPTELGQRPAACILRHSYYPDGHVRRDAETLVQAGYDVSVVALRRAGQPAREELNGVSIYRLPVEHHRGSVLRYVWEYGAFFLLAFLTVALLHARKRFRIVEIDNMPDVLVFCALVPKLTGARLILYIFDNMPELLQVTRGYSARHPLVRLLALLERASAAVVDRVIVTQEIARRVVRARGVPDARITTVLNCPDEAIFTPRPPAAAAGHDAFEIVTHGLILERFGVQTLIEALPAIAREVPTARLHVIGAGEYRAELERQVREGGLSERVELRSWVPLEELPDHLRRADAGYVGMHCDLMLSNKLMEYVALGIPAVVARWSVYEHYFPDDTVNYFRPKSAEALADAIVAIYRDPARARARAERAAELYRGYRWTVQREIYLGVYADLLAAPLRADRAGGSREPVATRW
jgi:glycosyltransferase involved in cell wall biosynthesis